MNPKLLFTLFWLFCSQVVIAQKQKEATFDEFESGKKKYAQDLHNLAIQKKDSLLLAEAYYLKGKQFLPTDYKKALENFLKALKILEPRGPSFELGRLYIRMSELALFAKNTTVSEVHAAKAREIFLLIKSERARNTWPGLFDNNMRSSYWVRNPGDLDKLMAPRVYGDAYSRLKNSAIDDTARNNLKMLIAFYSKQKADTRFAYLNCLWDLASSYTEAQDYSEARKIFKIAEAVEKEVHIENNIIYRSKHLSTWYDYYKATQNWKQAHNLLVKLKALENKREREEGMAQLRKLEMEYENEKKDNLINLKEAEVSSQKQLVSLQRKYLAGAGILISLLVILGGYLYRLFKTNQRISEINRRLLNEQNHRINNNLNSISSLIRLQSYEITDPQAAGLMEKSRLRIASIARLHKKLYTTHEPTRVFIPDFLEEIIADVLDTFGQSHIRQALSIDPIYLSAENAMHLGFICNEVLTNSCKYAFPGHHAPLLTIRFYLNKGLYNLEIADNGLKEPRFLIDKRTNFGMGLIELESEELHGKFQFRYLNGLLFSLRFTGKSEKNLSFI